MPYNVTVEDTSPMIKYSGQWTDEYRSTADSFTYRYREESYHSSQTAGAQVSFAFSGVAVYIFGAKRPNHGHYNVTLDNGEAQRFDGYAPTQPGGADGLFQVPLFAQTGLSHGPHTVVLTNDGESGRPLVDIDYVMWTSNDAAGSSNRTIDDSAWSFTSPKGAWGAWNPDSGYYNNTQHVTNVGGAQASVTFEGTGLYLYGGTLSNHGMFSVQVDDQTRADLNGSTKDYRTGQLLYYTDGLGAGSHTLTLTNTQEGTWLDVDYVDVIQSSPSPSSSKTKTAIIVGVVCGVVFVMCVIAVVWWLVRRRKQKAKNEPNDQPWTFKPPPDIPPRQNTKGQLAPVPGARGRDGTAGNQQIGMQTGAPELLHDRSSVSERSEDAYTNILPPDYAQAARSPPPRRA